MTGRPDVRTFIRGEGKREETWKSGRGRERRGRERERLPLAGNTGNRERENDRKEGQERMTGKNDRGEGEGLRRERGQGRGDKGEDRGGWGRTLLFISCHTLAVNGSR